MCGDQARIGQATAAFERARRIAAAPGAIRRNTLLLEQFGDSADPVVSSRLLRAVQS